MSPLLSRQIGSGPAPWARSWQIADGELGTLETLERMEELMLSPQEGSRDPRVVEFARAITRDLRDKDYLGEARRIFRWMHDTVRYVQDPRGMEYLATPYMTLFVTGTADCDEFTSTTGALAAALNHGVRFRLVKADPDRPDQFSHVYPLIGVRDNRGRVTWVAADASQPESYFGWEPPARLIFAREDYEVIPA